MTPRAMSKRVDRTLLAVLLLVGLFSVGPADADPGQWRAGFHIDGVAGDVRDVVVGVDAAGPALFVVGDIEAVGDRVMDDGGGSAGIVRFDGTTWSVVPTPPALQDQTIKTMVIVDEVGGPVLYVATAYIQAGDPGMLGRWDGTSWQVHEMVYVIDMTAWDDGQGEQLVFTGTVGGPSTRKVYLFDGSTFTQLAQVSSGETRIEAVELDGQRLLVVMGDIIRITPTGGPPIEDLNGIVSWDGTTWARFGDGFPQEGPLVLDVVVFDDGEGPKLYAGGAFRRNQGSPASRVARWTGTEWEALAGGNPVGTVTDLVVFDGPGTPTLVAIGEFTRLTDGRRAPQVAEWDGSGWAVLDGEAQFLPGAAPEILGGAAFGGSLYVQMTIDPTVGGPLAGLARWTGSAWATVAPTSPPGQGVIAPTGTWLVNFGSEVFANFEGYRVGSEETDSLFRWTGTNWESVVGFETPDAQQVRAMTLYDDGNGPTLYAGGTFNFTSSGGQTLRWLARLGPQGWEPVGGDGNTIGDPVLDLEVYDDGTGAVLAVAGSFGVAGGATARGIAMWDGTSWTTPLPSLEPMPGSQVTVTGLEVNGSRLLVAGQFAGANGEALNNVAAWDGTQWQALDDGSQVGVSSAVRDLAFLRRASAELACVLYDFDRSRVDCWNGTSWSSAPNADVGPFSLTEIEILDRFGELRLVAGGSSLTAQPAISLLLELDGGIWEPLGDVPTLTLGAVDDLLRVGDSLWVGGRFPRLGDAAASGVGVLDPCVGSCATLFFDGFESGDTSTWSNTVG